MNKLSGSTRIGLVSLVVADLNRSIAFYQEALGFKIHKKDRKYARLGAGKSDLLELVENKNAVRPYRTTGLYHFAILVPSRLNLAKSLQQLSATGTPVQGFADHLVSEAIYLPDPDGNGIEIYRDRSPEQWPRAGDGSLKMDNLPLDLEGILGELGKYPGGWDGLHKDTVIGHVHLHVSDLEREERFYTQGVGLDHMLHFGRSASFLSAGGYHHHLGINTWAGRGAPSPAKNSIGLRWFEFVVSSGDEVAAIERRIDSLEIETRRDGDLLMFSDLSGNCMRIRSVNDQTHSSLDFSTITV